jgi:SAM-dependent methyltransferase
MCGSLVQVHHEGYTDDLDFWESSTDGNDPVLELGCGHGRLTIPLARAGRKIVGLDLDLISIQYLHSEIEKETPDLQKRITTIQADMLQYQSELLFGSIIIPCNTYSIFTAEERRQLLGNAAQMLSQWGMFITSVPNPHWINALYENLPGDEKDAETDLETIIQHPKNKQPVQVSSRLISTSVGVRWDWIYDQMFPDGRVERFVKSTEHHLASLEMYRKEFQEAGFKVIEQLGDFDGASYDQEAPYLILAAKMTS